MSEFHFKGFDENGREAAGVEEAETLLEAVNKLEARGIQVLEIKPGSDTADNVRDDSAIGEAGARVVTSDDSKLASEHEHRAAAEAISQLATAGLPLVPGLRALAEELPIGRDRRALIKAASQLERGASLSEVFASANDNSDLRAVFRAAEMTDNPIEFVEEYFARSRSLASLKARMLLALSYPLVLVVLLFALLTLVMVWVVPEFDDLYRGFGVDLPWLTEALLRTADFMRRYWLVTFLVGVFTFGLMLVLIRSVCSPLTRRLMVWRIPIVGSLFKNAGLARFTHLLAVMVKREVPLPQALVIAGNASRDAVIADESLHLSQGVEQGDASLSRRRRMRQFPISLVELIAGDGHGRSGPEALHDLAAVFETQARIQTRRLIISARPIVMIFAGASILLTVIALFSPLFRLIGALA